MAQRILCILPPHYLSVISFLLTLLMPSFSLPSSLYLGTNRCHSRLPLWSAHASCRLDHGVPTSVWGTWLVAITLVLRLTGWIPLALSLASPTGTVPSTLVNSYFFISYFVLAYTYLFSAKLRSGCLFKFRPYVDCLRPWTMIFPWIFLFLYRHVFACSNKQNEYSQINPRRTTFPRRFVASNKLNINQLKF